MLPQQYEVHNLTDKELPIIYHVDRVSTAKPMVTSNWHENLELLYIRSGRGIVTCSGADHPVVPGDLVAINSYALHSVSSDSEVEYDCLIVDTDFLADNQVFVEKIRIDPLVREETARHMFDAVVQEIRSQAAYHMAGVRAQVLCLVVWLARNHAVPEVRSCTGGEAVHLAIGYLKAHYAQAITLEKLAQEVGLSKYHFARQFKKATGLTVVGFLNMLRCQNAAKLLLKKEYPIREIAARCGFDNGTYFAKTFRTYMGCLPSEYPGQT